MKQATLDRFVDRDRCRAYTLEDRRCPRDGLPNVGYCNQHLPLADAVLPLDD